MTTKDIGLSPGLNSQAKQRTRSANGKNTAVSTELVFLQATFPKLQTILFFHWNPPMAIYSSVGNIITGVES
jgi:hypothetical protein